MEKNTIYKEFSTCTICNLQYRKSSGYNQKVTKRHLAAGREYHCQHFEKVLILADKKDQLQSEEHRKKKTICYCEAFGKNININYKSFHIRDTAPLKKYPFSNEKGHFLLKKIYLLIQLFTS